MSFLPAQRYLPSSFIFKYKYALLLNSLLSGVESGIFMYCSSAFGSGSFVFNSGVSASRHQPARWFLEFPSALSPGSAELQGSLPAELSFPLLNFGRTVS